jgi:hypothetical protein
VSFGCICGFLFRKTVAYSMGDCAPMIHKAICNASPPNDCLLNGIFGFSTTLQVFQEMQRSSVFTFLGCEKKGGFIQINCALFSVCARTLLLV